MLTAVVTRAPQIDITFVAADEGEGEGITFEESQDFCEFPFENEAEFEASEYPCEEGPSPLAVEMKELAWGAGAFIVLALAMRFWLFPAVKKGMDQRYAHIRSGYEAADATRTAAQTDVADYEAALAEVKAEAAERVEAARQTLEAERHERLTAVNEAVAARRDAAAADAAAARRAVQGDVAAAVTDVSARTIELATGRSPDPAMVRAVADDVMGAEVPS